MYACAVEFLICTNIYYVDGDNFSSSFRDKNMFLILNAIDKACFIIYVWQLCVTFEPSVFSLHCFYYQLDFCLLTNKFQ